MAVHTEFYDPVVLEVGECIYLDSDMGHAYLAGPGCTEASFLAVCSSAEEGFMETLLGVHKKGAAAAVAALAGITGRRCQQSESSPPQKALRGVDLMALLRRKMRSTSQI